ncbi:peptidase inhibitor family I36 protein [Streptomyces sp. enrichment culture]|uniref:peptidase inhibitor family I36 protein n=1 Tax=Streptomyces sp. enrichment culture TaxID=1795815 RepID=UPI003F5639FD
MMLSVVGVGLTAAPAQAAKADCYAGAFCAYSQAGFAGTPGKVYENNTDLTGYYSFSHPKSIYNNGNSCDVVIYTGKGYTGNSMTIERGVAYTLGSDSTFRVHGIASNKWVNCR